jgi:hypothetical protein
MKRTAATVLVSLAIAVATLAPAAAAPGSGHDGAPAPHIRPAVVVPLCVSTTWRHERTGQPFTKPGQSCQVREGMWIPSSWVRVGVTYSADRSEAFEVYRRPAIHDHGRVVSVVHGADGSVTTTWSN